VAKDGSGKGRSQVLTQLPPDNLIECASIEDEAEVLLESPTDHV
jgi:hypothetical protein